MRLDDHSVFTTNKDMFGMFCTIEQKRYGGKNEHYLHKIVSRIESNTYVQVPVQVPATESIHDNVVPVVLAICCGIDETVVRRYRLEDIKVKS